VPRAEGLNLQEFIRRLWGPLSRAEPDVLPNIQPVYMVGDGSPLVPPLLPPAAFAGAFHNVGPLQFSGLEFQSLAPGGAFLRLVVESLPGGTPQARYALRTAPVTFNGVSAPNVHNFGSAPVTSVVRIGGVDAQVLGVLDPHRSNFELITWNDEFFVPPGRFAYFENPGVGIDTNWSVLWAELPASP